MPDVVAVAVAAAAAADIAEQASVEDPNAAAEQHHSKALWVSSLLALRLLVQAH